MHRVVTMAVAGLIGSPQALACGGFFCDQPAPRDTALFEPEAPRVDQTSERIVFVVDEGAGEVEVHVQVAYEGEVDAFAWVVPVPGVPELFVSPQALIDTLEATTAPLTELTFDVEGRCKVERDRSAGKDDADDTDVDFAEADDADTDTDAPPSDVTVVDRRDVGPYATVTLQARTAEALVAWLQREGFTIPDDAADAMRPYLTEDGAFVALRLQKDRDVGDIVPFGMRYAGTEAQIPLTLTRIAAVPDMRLLAWVMGPGRAVPSNYLHVVPNPVQLHWWNGGANRAEIIARAADEAGGQAFATDFAGQLGVAPAPQLWQEGWVDLPRLRTLGNALDWLVAVRGSTVSTLDGVLAVLEEHVPHPAGLDAYNCPTCYADELLALPFDAAAATDALEAQVVTPRRRAAALFTPSAWTTRLVSSMSPAEMSVDPVFVLNDAMPAVDRRDAATQVTLCDPLTFERDAPRELRIEGGPTIPLPSASWMAQKGWTFDDVVAFLNGPNAWRIEQTGRSGDPIVVQDNDRAVQAAIDDFAALFPRRAGGTATGCDGCSGAGGAGFGWGAVLLVGIAARRRRGA